MPHLRISGGAAHERHERFPAALSVNLSGNREWPGPVAGERHLPR